MTPRANVLMLALVGENKWRRATIMYNMMTCINMQDTIAIVLRDYNAAYLRYC